MLRREWQLSLATLVIALHGPAHAAPTAPVAVPDTLAQRAMACTACHGREGRATRDGYFPRIAGKPAEYLFQQLQHFRDGQRQNLVMQRLVRHLSDDYLRALAGYFASVDLPYVAPATAVSAPRGERLVREGDPQRGVPACVACHGEAMTGTLPAIPGLLGLPSDYLIAQLGNWKTGQRHARAPDCMHAVAEALDANEVADVARWLAAQPVPVPAHAQPLPAGRTLPAECGSQPR